ncbi:hypothetical protein LAZ67_3004575 [Cordylochernes scorpioides]|uniref:General transcription factor II-I repeat domain-containing protein 2 n=1 Tax=Cordylochernes scorpioides TaxID=51811 RepID=A0ABY6KAV0_9ARAC|nr:hypothetical protein LAZ67_3004575 [Cordylochernes scorpioides]
MHCGLRAERRPQLLCALLLNSPDLLRRDLAGINVLLPDLLPALELVLLEKELPFLADIQAAELRHREVSTEVAPDSGKNPTPPASANNQTGLWYISINNFFQTFVFNMSSSKPSGSKTKRKIADEHRNFQEKWELEYFCSEVKDKIIYLICNNAISVPKLYNIKHHYEQHKSKYDTYEGLMRQEKLKEFKLGMKKQQFMFTKVSQKSEAAVHASYVLSEMIAKHSKPFTEGDFIKECLIKAAEIVCPGSVKTFQAISLSRNTVVERVTDMARNLNDQIKEKSFCFEAFSIACDESTDIGGVAQLAVFFRACDTDFNIFEELLELVPMHVALIQEKIYLIAFMIFCKNTIYLNQN